MRNLVNKTSEILRSEVIASPLTLEPTSTGNLTNPKTNPDFGQIATGALSGLLTGVAQTLAPSQTVAQVGATAVDNTLMATLKKNWLKYLGILTIVGATIGIVMYFFNRKPKR